MFRNTTAVRCWRPSRERQPKVACCASRDSVGRTFGGTSGTTAAAALDIADASAPPRASFAGGRAHTGTRKPIIPLDGEGVYREHRLTPFSADITLVTNARYAAFVADTGYVTESERFGWGLVFRGLLPDPEAVPLSQSQTPWWVKVDGACWHAPEGPGSSVKERADHPVTHISWEDATAFAKWAGGRLPGEAEWEHAARGGLNDPKFFWGDEEPNDKGFMPCNIWQGQFPGVNTCADGWFGTSPVTAFSPNHAGIHDMAGNVWEWTAEPFRIRSAGRYAQHRNEEARRLNQKLMKGGSFLCHASYCYRYRIAARLALVADSGASNSGFRVFYDN